MVVNVYKLGRSFKSLLFKSSYLFAHFEIPNICKLKFCKRNKSQTSITVVLKRCLGRPAQALWTWPQERLHIWENIVRHYPLGPNLIYKHIMTTDWLLKDQICLVHCRWPKQTHSTSPSLRRYNPRLDTLEPSSE